MSVTTRFAPSPSGPLHLGHAFAALVAHDLARAAGGRFVLRIEDIDRTRSRSSHEAAIHADLAWLGLHPDGPVMKQSDRIEAYRQALDTLWADGLLYVCTCTRRDIAEAARAPQEGMPLHGPDGLVYPGTCRPDRPNPQDQRPDGDTLRLNMAAVLERIDTTLSFEEAGPGQRGTLQRASRDLSRSLGDIVLSRRDFLGSYHLAVVLDDAAQQITHVTRGADLFEATWIHVVLQELLGLPRPIYHHHRLIRNEAGRRLAKRDGARAIASYRDKGVTPKQIRALLAPINSAG